MKRLYPERTVVCFAGDGDFLMNGQEFATAVQYDLPIIVVIVRQRHVRHHPHAPGARISRPRHRPPTLRNPDFAAYARAFGGFGATVEKTADFAAAFERAQASGKPAIIHLQDRPGGDHAGNDARQDPRQVAGGEESRLNACFSVCYALSRFSPRDRLNGLSPHRERRPTAGRPPRRHRRRCPRRPRAKAAWRRCRSRRSPNAPASRPARCIAISRPRAISVAALVLPNFRARDRRAAPCRRRRARPAFRACRGDRDLRHACAAQSPARLGADRRAGRCRSRRGAAALPQRARGRVRRASSRPWPAASCPSRMRRWRRRPWSARCRRADRPARARRVGTRTRERCRR